jgi:hypothetical protein
MHRDLSRDRDGGVVRDIPGIAGTLCVVQRGEAKVCLMEPDKWNVPHSCMFRQ